MKINRIVTARITMPLKSPFKTALRTVEEAESIVVMIEDEAGHTGYGSAPPTVRITGENLLTIQNIIEKEIKPFLQESEITSLDERLHLIDEQIIHNTSAKAAVEMALFDLHATRLGISLQDFFGGGVNTLTTDITVSIGKPEEMRKDAETFLQQGYTILKLKIAGDRARDVSRLEAVAGTIENMGCGLGQQAAIRVDANQAFSPKEAVKFASELEAKGIELEVLEQPVQRQDWEGLKFVRERVNAPVLADESVFSPADAMELLAMEAVDMLNIKLMKCGGLRNAIKINAVAEARGIPCMIGCMLENSISVSAAFHLASASTNIVKYDLDAPLLLAVEPLKTYLQYDGPHLTLVENAPGLGVKQLDVC